MLCAELLVALAATATEAHGGAREHGPIAIYQPTLMSPPEAAGSGLRPLVRAKLFIDAAGRVTRVEVTGVEPASPMDGSFRAAAIAGLTRWRFAAAEKGGQSVASETSIALQFDPPSKPFGDGGGGTADDWISDPDRRFESYRYENRARILAMESVARRKVADEISAQAEALLKKGQRAYAADDWFEVVTDFGGQKQAEALLHNAGAIFGALYKLLGERIPPKPREDRIRIFVFETLAQYQAFAAQASPFEGSEGVYCSAGVMAFHAQHPTIGFFVASMLHETTHAFIDRHVTRTGVLLPRWLDEGLAEYVGISDIKDGRIVPGSHAKGQELGAAPGAIVYWQTGSKLRADDAKRAQRQKHALKLSEIVSAGTETFYGKDVELYYSQGWLAVHFLRHGRPEWKDDAFPKFLLYAAEGYPADQAFRTAYGADASDLESEYQRYVKSF